MTTRKRPFRPKGCTSVEEWIEKGGTITRTRAHGEAIIREHEGTRFEWLPIGDAIVKPARYRCRRTGVLGYDRVQGNKIVPYICRHPNCTAYARHRSRGNQAYCDEHVGGES